MVFNSEKALLSKANAAYDFFVSTGPFYGKDIPNLPPTFRVSAEPVVLSNELKVKFEELGRTLVKLASSLPQLPHLYLSHFAQDMTYIRPITFRLDVIIDENNQPQVNEINTIDGADALMVAEQIAYGISSLEVSSAARLLQVMDFLYGIQANPNFILIAENTHINPYLANFRRMIRFLEKLSPNIKTHIVDSKNLTPALWQSAIVYNTSHLSPRHLHEILGSEIPVVNYGSWHALSSKVVMALIHNPDLDNFWYSAIGDSQTKFLRSIIPKTERVSNEAELLSLLREKVVIKGYKSSIGNSYLERGRSVFGPWSSDDERKKAVEYHRQGIDFIAQEYITPKRISVDLRKNGGRSLEKRTGYNRICLKYVLTPNEEQNTLEPILTASEATIGTGVIPTGRDCCFTAVDYR